MSKVLIASPDGSAKNTGMVGADGRVRAQVDLLGVRIRPKVDFSANLLIVNWNPQDIAPLLSLSQSDLLVSSSAGNVPRSVRATLSNSVGIKYFEVLAASLADAANPGNIGIGVSSDAYDLQSILGGSEDSWAHWRAQKAHAGVFSAYGVILSAQDTIGVMVDFSTGNLSFLVDNVNHGVAFNNLSGQLFPTVCLRATGTQARGRFSDADFAFDPPAGAISWSGDQEQSPDTDVLFSPVVGAVIRQNKRTVYASSAAEKSVRLNVTPNGKRYWEVLYLNRGTSTNTQSAVGVIDAALGSGQIIGSGLYSYRTSGAKNGATSGDVAFGEEYVAGDILMAACDFDNDLIWFGRNGTWQGSGNPSAGLNPAFSMDPVRTYSPCLMMGGHSAVSYRMRSKVSDLHYPLPDGFLALEP